MPDPMFPISKQQEMLKIANEMIAGSISLIDGSREIVRLRKYTSSPNDDVFEPFIILLGQFDDVPFGDIQKEWEPHYLKQLQKEMNDYLDSNRSSILKDCVNLLARFS